MRVPELIAATVSGLASQLQGSAHRAARLGDRWSRAAHRCLPGDVAEPKQRGGTLNLLLRRTPDQFNDSHTALANGFTYHGVHYTGDQASIEQGDNFLSIVVPMIESSQAYKNNGAIIIWWDETEGGTMQPIHWRKLLFCHLPKGMLTTASFCTRTHLALSIQLGRKSSPYNSEDKEVSHTNLAESPKCGLSQRRWS